MKNLTPDMIEKAAAEKRAEEGMETTDAQELSDDMLDGVSGGLVQLVNPSSARL